MKIKFNQLFYNHSYNEYDTLEKFIVKDKEYFVIAIRFTAEKGGEVLIITEYLYRPKWLPLQGLEVIDNYIPSHWQCGEFNTEIGKGICYCSNMFNIDILNNGYTALYDNLYYIVSEEVKELKRLNLLNNNDDSNTLNNEVLAHMNRYELENLTAEMFTKIKPDRHYILNIINKIESFIRKYNLDNSWLFFTNKIKNGCSSKIDDTELAHMVLESMSGSGSLGDLYIPDSIVQQHEFYKLNNELELLKELLNYCGEYLLAKKEYLYLFED